MVDGTDGQLNRALERLGALEDERAILDCLYAYSHGLDGKQFDDFRDCFTDDGRFAWEAAARGRLGVGGSWPRGARAVVPRARDQYSGRTRAPRPDQPSDRLPRR